MAQQSADEPLPTVLLLTHARTASRLLGRMLSKQPNTLCGEEWFLPARFPRRALLSAGPVENTDPKLQQEFMEKITESVSRFENFLSDAETQSKIAFPHIQPHSMANPALSSEVLYGPHNGLEKADVLARFHVGADTSNESGRALFTNPTVMPDALLLRPGTIPVINFRHPMLVCDGVYRGISFLPHEQERQDGRKFIVLGATLHWQRLMYEWYVEHGATVGVKPILLDADDYLGPEKEALMRNLCDRIPGWEHGSVIYKWPKTTPEEMKEIPQVLQEVYQTLLASDGVMPGYDMRGRDIESQMAIWIEKYGQEEADFIRGLVDKAMPDYEFLRAHRLKPHSS